MDEREQLIKGLEQLLAFLEISSRQQLLGAKYTKYGFVVEDAIKFIKEIKMSGGRKGKKG